MGGRSIADQSWHAVSCPQCLFSNGGYTWLDVRSELENDEVGKVKGSVNVPFVHLKRCVQASQSVACGAQHSQQSMHGALLTVLWCCSHRVYNPETQERDMKVRLALPDSRNVAAPQPSCWDAAPKVAKCACMSCESLRMHISPSSPQKTPNPDFVKQVGSVNSLRAGVAHRRWAYSRGSRTARTAPGLRTRAS